MRFQEDAALILCAGIFTVLFARFGFAGDSAAMISDSRGGGRQIAENVMEYPTADLTMAAAMQKARASLPRFFQLSESGLRGNYLVKMALTSEDGTEHIWMEVSAYRNGVFHGHLANDPTMGKARMGDPVTVRHEEVEDWMINTGEARYGGYTVRAMLKDMPKEQAEELRAQFRD